LLKGSQSKIDRLQPNFREGVLHVIREDIVVTPVVAGRISERLRGQLEGSGQYDGRDES
jgi:hypothetical protein